MRTFKEWHFVIPYGNLEENILKQSDEQNHPAVLEAQNSLEGYDCFVVLPDHMELSDWMKSQAVYDSANDGLNTGQELTADILNISDEVDAEKEMPKITDIIMEEEFYVALCEGGSVWQWGNTIGKEPQEIEELKIL